MNSTPPTSTKQLKTKPNYVPLNSESNTNQGFSTKQYAVLASLAFIIVIGLVYSLLSRYPIRLVGPLNNQTLAAKELNFTWVCDKKDISFVIEVYDAGNNSELVLRQIIDKNTKYTPAPTQLYNLKANHNYRWIVMPNPDIIQKYNFRSEPRYFTINEALTNITNIVNSPEQSAPDRNKNNQLTSPTIPPPISKPLKERVSQQPEL